MKIRDSGMPDENMWSGFFSPDEILRIMGLDQQTGPVLDMGCGYGTFSISAAKITVSTVYAMDIEKEMVDVVAEKAQKQNLGNIKPMIRDFAVSGTGLSDVSVSYVMLFNILHAEDPLGLLKEAYRVLARGGKVGIIHWIYDERTPRGPAMNIRPKPEQCRDWAIEAGFKIKDFNIPLKPYHYGIIAIKSEEI